MPPTWNEGSFQKQVVRDLVRELKQLVEEYSSHVLPFTGKTCIAIKDEKSGKKLIEYWPEKNLMRKTKDDHKTIINNEHDDKRRDLLQKLSDDYHSTINPREEVRDYKILIEHLRRIFDALYFGITPIDEHQSQPDRTLISNTQDHGFYLPTRQDVDNARRKCLREGRKSISIDDMLDILENDLKEAGHQLAENWRSVTEENIAIWSERD